jgi:hypothetical protein
MWRKRYNHELYELFNEPDIVKYIKINRLGWAGFVIRMDNNRTVKKVFNTKPTGIRKIRRPKLRWEDDVTQDVKILAVKNWTNEAMEKESWQKLLRKARAHVGHILPLLNFKVGSLVIKAAKTSRSSRQPILPLAVHISRDKL